MCKKIIAVIFIVFIGCQTSGDYSIQEIENFKKQVFHNQQTSSYGDLSLYYSYGGAPNYHEKLSYALKLRKKETNCYFEFYKTYLEIMFNNKFNDANIIKLPKEEQQYLLYMLKCGAKNNNLHCQKTLAKYYKYGLGVNKNTQKSDSLHIAMGIAFKNIKI